MAIGLARILGIDSAENFIRPNLSRSVSFKDLFPIFLDENILIPIFERYIILINIPKYYDLHGNT